MPSKIAKVEPQTAYSCFTGGYKQKLNYVMRTIPEAKYALKALDDVITQDFIPAITGGICCSKEMRELLSLPTKLGGLGLPIFQEISDIEYKNSLKVTSVLKDRIINQERSYNNVNLKPIKNKIKNEKVSRHLAKLDKLKSKMSDNKRKLNEINNESTASLWLSSLPLKEEGYVLDKQTFWDSVRVRYGWQMTRVPDDCVCGSKFSVEHALSCKKGGFVTLRHNEIRDVTTKLLNEVCKDVASEPVLQTLTGETFNNGTANKMDNARVDIKARRFWTTGQTAFFDVRVFNPLAARYREADLKKCYSLNEKEKKKNYNERIINVEHGSFTPIVMSANGGIAREGDKFYSRLAEMISEKRKTPYNYVITWIRRKSPSP